MNRNLLMAATAVVLLVISGFSLRAAAQGQDAGTSHTMPLPLQTTTATSWEYRVEDVRGRFGVLNTNLYQFEQLLKERAKEGWRLHTVANGVLIFERPRG